MEFKFDIHTHTVASGHAYSSMQENIQVAKDKGLELYGVSDHGPRLPGASQIYYFNNIRVVPREMNGILILRGVEANILDVNGTIDMTEDGLEYIDYVIASSHLPCIGVGTIEENTMALVNAMKNPRVNFIGHPDDSRIPLDYDILVKAAKEYNVALEVNNSSLNPTGFRLNARDNILKMLKLANEYGVFVLVSSDAHISVDVGNFRFAQEVIELSGIDEELVLNTSVDKLLKFIKFTG